MGAINNFQSEFISPQ